MSLPVDRFGFPDFLAVATISQGEFASVTEDSVVSVAAEVQSPLQFLLPLQHPDLLAGLLQLFVDPIQVSLHPIHPVFD